MKARFDWIAAACALGGWLVFQASVLVSLHERWWTFGDTYEIGYPVVCIGIWLVSINRHDTVKTFTKPSLLGIAFFICTLLMSGLGRLSQVQLTQQLMVPVSLWCGIWALFGWAAARKLLMPCMLLLAAIPVWDFLTNPLRLAAVWAARELLSATQIPFYVIGFQFNLPAGGMNVGLGCSGVNLLLASIVLSLTFAEIHLRSTRRKVLLVAIGAVVGILDNWIRVALLVFVGYYTEMQSRLVYDHADFGWWLFALSMCPLFFIARQIATKDTNPLPLANKFDTRNWSPSNFAFRSAYVAFLIAGFSIVLCVALNFLERRRGSAVLGFQATERAQQIVPQWLPNYSGYDIAQGWRLEDDSHDYELVALTYLSQKRDKKLIYYSNVLAKESFISSASKSAIESGDIVNVTIIHDGKWRIVWWQYWVDGVFVTSTWQVKLLQLKTTLFGDPVAAFVAVSTVCKQPDCHDEMAGAARPSGLSSLFGDLKVHRDNSP